MVHPTEDTNLPKIGLEPGKGGGEDEGEDEGESVEVIVDEPDGGSKVVGVLEWLKPLPVVYGTVIGLEQCDARTKNDRLPGEFRYYIPSPFGDGDGESRGGSRERNGKNRRGGGEDEERLAGGYVLVQRTYVKSTKSGLKEKVSNNAPIPFTQSLNTSYPRL